MEIIGIIITLLIITFIVIPISFKLCKEKIWEFVKENIEKEEKYRKMVKNMVKEKK